MHDLIQEEMVQAFAAEYAISLTDGSQRPGIVGSLTDLVYGRGTLPQWMREKDVFEGLVKAYDDLNPKEPESAVAKDAVDAEKLRETVRKEVAAYSAKVRSIVDNYDAKNVHPDALTSSEREVIAKALDEKNHPQAEKFRKMAERAEEPEVKARLEKARKEKLSDATRRKATEKAEKEKLSEKEGRV